MTTTLARELEQLGVAGRIITPVRDVYRKARMLEAGDRGVAFGLETLLPTSVDEVIDALRRLARTEFAAEGTGARDRSMVDPDALVEQAELAGRRLRQACERRERVLFGTGHPAGPIEMYVLVAQAMAAGGAEVMRVAEGEPVGAEGYRGEIRYVAGVACFGAGGGLAHTHSAAPMEYLLSVGPTPDLVVGDHGFCGAGLARGADAVAVVDTNDPALVLAWARGLPVHPLLCDDNRPPNAYLPLAHHLISALGPRKA